MTKDELVEQVAVAFPDIAKSTIKGIIGSTFVAISTALQKGEQVSIAKFGIFDVRESEARTGRNPRTGEAIEIEAKKRVGFRASANLKGLIQ